MCAVRTHAFSIFPATPIHRVRALRHTPYRRFKGRLKKRSRRLFHLPCDKGCLKNLAVDISGILFSDGLQRLNPLQPTPSPVGEGWGEGILRIAAIFPNTLTAPIQALRLVALSLALSHGEKGRAAVGVEVCCKENRLCRLLFIFQTTCINGCKSKLLFKLLKSQNPQQPAPSPVGEGWGEGILQIAATFPNISTVQIQALRLVALSLALSHEERGRVSC